jgi:hypothetical protein
MSDGSHPLSPGRGTGSTTRSAPCSAASPRCPRSFGLALAEAVGGRGRTVLRLLDRSLLAPAGPRRFMMAQTAATAGTHRDEAVGWAEQSIDYARERGHAHELGARPAGPGRPAAPGPPRPSTPLRACPPSAPSATCAAESAAACAWPTTARRQAVALLEQAQATAAAVGDRPRRIEVLARLVRAHGRATGPTGPHPSDPAGPLGARREAGRGGGRRRAGRPGGDRGLRAGLAAGPAAGPRRRAGPLAVGDRGGARACRLSAVRLSVGWRYFRPLAAAAGVLAWLQLRFQRESRLEQVLVGGWGLAPPASCAAGRRGRLRHPVRRVGWSYGRLRRRFQRGPRLEQGLRGRAASPVRCWAGASLGGVHAWSCPGTGVRWRGWRRGRSARASLRSISSRFAVLIPAACTRAAQQLFLRPLGRGRQSVYAALAVFPCAVNAAQ